MDNVYKIKKKLKIPMAMATIASIPVFIDVITQNQDQSVQFMAVLLMVIFYLLTINNILRKFVISDNEVSIRGLLGVKKIPINEITIIDAVIMGSRQFVSISNKKQNFLISNSYDDFPGLVEAVEKIAPEGTLGEGFKSLKGNIIERKSDVAGAWIAVILLLIIMLIRFYPK